MRLVALIFKINLDLINMLNYTSEELTGYLHCEYPGRWDFPLSLLGTSYSFMIIPVQQATFTRVSNLCSVPHRQAVVRQTCCPSSSIFSLQQGQ